MVVAESHRQQNTIYCIKFKEFDHLSLQAKTSLNCTNTSVRSWLNGVQSGCKTRTCHPVSSHHMWLNKSQQHQLTGLQPPPHLDHRQVRVQVREAVQDHRTGVLHHLQLHPVPNVPHLPRRVEHFEQLSRFEAARLGLHPREIDHGCRSVTAARAAFKRRFLGVFKTDCCSWVRLNQLRGLIAAV